MCEISNFSLNTIIIFINKINFNIIMFIKLTHFMECLKTYNLLLYLSFELKINFICSAYTKK